MLRQTALKLSVANILSAPLTKQENSVFLSVGEDLVNRVNVMGTVISFSPDDKQLVIDDGSGQLTVRWFDQVFASGVGELVMVIGRIREFNQRYVFPEIIKRITNPLWVEVRKKELGSQPVIQSEAQSVPAEPEGTSALKLIHDMDAGDGADMDELVSRLGAHGEEMLKKLLMAGEIFEWKPGKVRIL